MKDKKNKSIKSGIFSVGTEKKCIYVGSSKNINRLQKCYKKKITILKKHKEKFIQKVDPLNGIMIKRFFEYCNSKNINIDNLQFKVLEYASKEEINSKVKYYIEQLQSDVTGINLFSEINDCCEFQKLYVDKYNLDYDLRTIMLEQIVDGIIKRYESIDELTKLKGFEKENYNLLTKTFEDFYKNNLGIIELEDIKLVNKYKKASKLIKEKDKIINN